MRRYLSPLRYPGGKGRLAPYISALIKTQSPRPTQYAEPFAGGAGAALRLLVDRDVERIHINDLNPGIAAFWRAMFTQTEQFTDLIAQTPITMESWHRAREVYNSPEDRDDLSLGFATFFLNRCNRSGILTARPIGGMEQAGKWTLDARFNRESLIDRVGFVGGFRDQVTVTGLDARDFLGDLDEHGDDVLVYVDPPYLVQGEQLYMNSLSSKDHATLAAQLRNSDLKWLLTYDADRRVTDELYAGHRCVEFDIAHTAAIQHVGVEYAVFSESVALTDHAIMRRGDARWLVN
ncbi:DNA adenine methylase [Rhodococcus qingshengii]|uniref:site-specific DNA-methyltransferase (adenine-specific) n=1 Tax=Rhodococcus qingshengii TaxID=334542 RepID=A0A2A5J160_RHOSG|nr:DNA adenine methylase [Rhodococcus qingshengii]PCK23253.1 DNA methyltransferase [Rhodococcus qingshengii]